MAMAAVCTICQDETVTAGPWPVGQWLCGTHDGALCGPCSTKLRRRRCPLCRQPPVVAEVPLRAGEDFTPPQADVEFVGSRMRTSPEAQDDRSRNVSMGRIARVLAFFDERHELRRSLATWKPWYLPTLRAVEAAPLTVQALEELSLAAHDMSDAIYFFETTTSEKQRWTKWAPAAEAAASTTERLLAGHIAPPEHYEPLPSEPTPVQPAFEPFHRS